MENVSWLSWTGFLISLIAFGMAIYSRYTLRPIMKKMYDMGVIEGRRQMLTQVLEFRAHMQEVHAAGEKPDANANFGAYGKPY
jgi:hypothetical protein